jgi:alpha-tubulin suppressor-like RCC1 family protein
VRGLPAIAEIATGGEFGAALSTDGRVFTWGFNSAGQLGRGASAAPAEVPALRGATTLALGHSFACARKGDGTLACWGHHSSGEAGVGKRPADEYGVVRIERPEAVAGLSGVRSVATHSLASHACAVREDGTVACWGANETGQLGTGDRRNRESPTVVPGLQDVERVVVGELYTCAQLRSGEVRCWGANHLGQLGTSRALGMCKLPYVADSSAVPCSLSPVPVKGL